MVIVYHIPMKIKTPLRNFLFPKFSELELVTLLFILLLFVIEHFYKAIIFIIVSYVEAWNTFDVRGLIGYTLALLYVLFIFGKATEHALSQKKMAMKDKETLAMVFYLLLSGVTLISLWGRPFIRTDSTVNTIESFITVFIMGRAFLSMFATAHFSKKNQDIVYAGRLTDEQLTKKELSVAVIISIVLYFFLRRENESALSIVLTYFYATSLVIFSRQNREKVMSFFQHMLKG